MIQNKNIQCTRSALTVTQLMRSRRNVQCLNWLIRALCFHRQNDYFHRHDVAPPLDSTSPKWMLLLSCDAFLYSPGPTTTCLGIQREDTVYKRVGVCLSQHSKRGQVLAMGYSRWIPHPRPMQGTSGIGGVTTAGIHVPAKPYGRWISFHSMNLYPE